MPPKTYQRLKTQDYMYGIGVTQMESQKYMTPGDFTDDIVLCWIPNLTLVGDTLGYDFLS